MCQRMLTGAIGITIIITSSKLFRWLQNVHYFFKCSLCVGFWVGIIMYYLSINEPIQDQVIETVSFGGTVSICSYTWKLLMSYFIKRYD